MYRGRKDKLSGRWKALLMKDTEDIVIERSTYDDFSTPTPWRTYELIVSDRTFYVNAGWLAELSPYFAETAFARKPPLKKLNLEDSVWHEVLEFLRCIFFCPMRKPLSVKNVSLVLKYATRFDMRPVIARCEHFISANAKTLDQKKLFQVTCAMSQCDPNSSTMSVLVDRLAAIKEDDLSRMQFSEMPGDVVAEINYSMTETTGTPRKNSSKKEKATSKSPSRSNSNRKEVEDEKLRQGLTPPPKKPILKSGSLSSKQTSNEPAKAVKPQVKEKRQNEESNAATESPNGDKIVVGENFPMLAEELQVMLTRGEHLTRRPVGLLLLLAVELIVCTATLIVWSTMGDNPPLPMILAIFNLLLIFVILVGIICVEFMRFQVREASVNRNESRYTIPYAWKIALFSMHVFRIWLISANLTIAIVDNKYDPGSVTMMAVQPLMLLICLVHVIFVLRPHHDR